MSDPSTGRRGSDRREFLTAGVKIGVPAVLLGGGGVARAKPRPHEPEVSPTEDLMREHGILRRLLLVYGEVVRRIESNQPVGAEPIAAAAQIIRAFVEDYHERDEEEFIFPRFVKAGKMTELVGVLLAQHQAGRKLTAGVQRLATATALTNAGSRRELAQSMRLFIRMYEPHAAREDTVLFPAFAALVGEKALHELQETFERKEKALPGGDFEQMVTEVAKIETSLGIGDLAAFTPR